MHEVRDVAADGPEPGVALEVSEVRRVAGEQVVEADHLDVLRHEAGAQV